MSQSAPHNVLVLIKIKIPSQWSVTTDSLWGGGAVQKLPRNENPQDLPSGAVHMESKYEILQLSTD